MPRLFDDFLRSDEKCRRGAENGRCSCEIGIVLSTIVENMKTLIFKVKTGVFKTKKIVADMSIMVFAFAKMVGVLWKSS